MSMGRDIAHYSVTPRWGYEPGDPSDVGMCLGSAGMTAAFRSIPSESSWRVSVSETFILSRTIGSTFPARLLMRDGRTSKCASMCSRMSRVLVASSTIVVWAVVRVPGPPRSLIRSFRQRLITRAACIRPSTTARPFTLILWVTRASVRASELRSLSLGRRLRILRALANCWLLVSLVTPVRGAEEDGEEDRLSLAKSLATFWASLALPVRFGPLGSSRGISRCGRDGVGVRADFSPGSDDGDGMGSFLQWEDRWPARIPAAKSAEGFQAEILATDSDGRFRRGMSSADHRFRFRCESRLHARRLSSARMLLRLHR